MVLDTTGLYEEASVGPTLEGYSRVDLLKKIEGEKACCDPHAISALCAPPTDCLAAQGSCVSCSRHTKLSK